MLLWNRSAAPAPPAAPSVGVIDVVEYSGRTSGLLEKDSPSKWLRMGIPDPVHASKDSTRALRVRLRPSQHREGELELYERGEEIEFLGIRYVHPRSGYFGSNYTYSNIVANKGGQPDRLDTWAFAVCGRSKPATVYKLRCEALHHADAIAASAIWSVTNSPDGVKQLRLYWIESDRAKRTRLGVYQPVRGGPLVIHRIRDVKDSKLKAARVRLVFSDEVDVPAEEHPE